MKHPTYYKTVPVVDTDDDAEADSNNLHQHESRATADWDEYVEKGNKLYTDLEHAVKTKHEAPDKFNAFRAWSKNDKIVKTLPSEVGSAMHSDGIPTVISQGYRYWETLSPKGQTKYDGFFTGSSNPTAMVEMYALKGPDADIAMSEVAFQTAAWALDGEETHLKKLEYIYKPDIVNPVTKIIMQQAYENSCEQGNRIVFDSGTDEFKALLATPNGAIAPRVLIDRAGVFQKSIKEIRLYLRSNMMVFKLG